MPAPQEAARPRRVCGRRVALLSAVALALAQRCSAQPPSTCDASEEDAAVDLDADDLCLLQRSVSTAKLASRSLAHRQPPQPAAGDFNFEDAQAVRAAFEAALAAARAGGAGGARPAARSSHEVLLQPGEVCIWPQDVTQALKRNTDDVLKGLPAWTAAPKVPPSSSTVTIAYFVQVSIVKKLPLVRRAFDRLYSDQDVFLYEADSRYLYPEQVRDALGLIDPATGERLKNNVRIYASPHADYFYWPRVKVVLDGLNMLLQDSWDFVVHLSESDYPVHSPSWIRATLAGQRNSNFIHAVPRCEVGQRELLPLELLALNATTVKGNNFEDAKAPDARSGGVFSQDPWYWWGQNHPVASCGGEFRPVETTVANYPTAELERGGFVFARGPEWVILTRELVEYASQPGLAPFKRLIGMHPGADELFWSAMVFNIPNYTQKISKQGWYMHWDKRASGHSPEVIGPRHMAHIMEERDKFLFTRKVDLRESAEVLQMLDAASDAENLFRPVYETPASAQDWSVPPIMHWRVQCHGA